MARRIYVGHIAPDDTREVFKSETEPTQATHGSRYFAVTGPFRTMRGARFLAEHGRGNPHIQHVNDAERLARGN